MVGWLALIVLVLIVAISAIVSLYRCDKELAMRTKLQGETAKELEQVKQERDAAKANRNLWISDWHQERNKVKAWEAWAAKEREGGYLIDRDGDLWKPVDKNDPVDDRFYQLLMPVGEYVNAYEVSDVVNVFQPYLQGPFAQPPE